MMSHMCATLKKTHSSHQSPLPIKIDFSKMKGWGMQPLVSHVYHNLSSLDPLFDILFWLYRMCGKQEAAYPIPISLFILEKCGSGD